MSKKFVGMGDYYRANPYGLVRTVCKAFDDQSGEAMIAYVNVSEGGYVSDVFLMPEVQFKNIFLN